MTRINVIDPEFLEDSMLMGEFHEITRVLNYKIKGPIPDQYKMGSGHARFFRNKLGFLHKRYKALYDECLKRGFNVNWNWWWPDDPESANTKQDWSPKRQDLVVNLERIVENMYSKSNPPRYYREEVDPDYLVSVYRFLME